MTKIEELIAEQRTTNELLKILVEAQSGAISGRLTVDDEIRMVRASGQDIVAYLKTRRKKDGQYDKQRKNSPRGRAGKTR